MKPKGARVWIARLLIAIVMGWNLECALAFLISPAQYAAGFELSGIAGETAVRGMAVLFIMWNIPYVVALWQPQRHRLSLWEALAMQIVGVVGESLIFFYIPAGHPTLQQSLVRFIIFDVAGVGLLLGALWLGWERVSGETIA